MAVSKQTNLVGKLFGLLGSDGHFENDRVENIELLDSNEESSSTHQAFGTLGKIRVNAEAYEKRSRERSRVELTDMSLEDIKALRMADPFLYYSLPANLRSGRLRSEPANGKGEKLTVLRRTTVSAERCPIETVFLDCSLDTLDHSDVDSIDDELLMLDITDSFVLGSHRFATAAHRRSSC